MSATATIPDLWPTDFKVGSEPSPATILRQQGYILGERTRDVVFGEVESELESSTQFRHTLFLTAPYCKVRLPAVIVEHRVVPYPAELLLVSGPGKPIRAVTATNSEQFVERLREMLASQPVVQLVGSLIAQARELSDE